MAFFRIIAKDKNSGARAGILKTAHGIVKTPSYVIVGTHAEVRCLEPSDISRTKTQIIIANTYHLWRENNFEIEGLENLYKRTKWQIPTMTDSGGFQVFSLGFGREYKIGKVAPVQTEEIFGASLSNICNKVKQKNLVHPVKNSPPQRPFGRASAGEISNGVKITDDGVYFFDDSKKVFLNAEKSIQIQKKLGADIILAFDECTSPLHDYEYTKRAMARTHTWARQSLRAKTRPDQFLYGIVQGGIFEDLRKESAKFIGALPFDGFAIGGAFSAAGAFPAIDWIVPYLPEEKPRHLLGVGKIADLFEAVALGIDTFDCVIPTREARHGGLWTRAEGRLSIKRGIYKKDKKKIDRYCDCPVCADWKINRSELHALFKAKEPQAARLVTHPDGRYGARFATIHNVYFFNNLLEEIRESILAGKFGAFKSKFLSRIRFDIRI